MLASPSDRVDGEAKVTGKAVFTAELDLPGLALRGARVQHRSPAGGWWPSTEPPPRAVPGFVALLTHENMPRLARPRSPECKPEAGVSR